MIKQDSIIQRLQRRYYVDEYQKSIYSNDEDDQDQDIKLNEKQFINTYYDQMNNNNLILASIIILTFWLMLLTLIVSWVWGFNYMSTLWYIVFICLIVILLKCSINILLTDYWDGILSWKQDCWFSNKKV